MNIVSSMLLSKPPALYNFMGKFNESFLVWSQLGSVALSALCWWGGHIRSCLGPERAVPVDYLVLLGPRTVTCLSGVTRTLSCPTRSVTLRLSWLKQSQLI